MIFWKINLSFHNSLQVKHIAIKEKYWTYYLCQYFPDLAPMKFALSRMKRKLRSYLGSFRWNFKTRKGCNCNIMNWYMSRIYLKDVEKVHQEFKWVHLESRMSQNWANDELSHILIRLNAKSWNSKTLL